MNWDESPEPGNGVRGFNDYGWVLYAAVIAVGVLGIGTVVVFGN